MSKLDLVCFTCGKHFLRYKSSMKGGEKFIYCSRTCMGKHRKELGIKPPSMLGKKRPEHSKRMSGENSPFWKGGRQLHQGKYWILLKPEHPFADRYGYVREHRLVMEDKLGRYLERHEIVHHINHDSIDNRPENLMLLGIVEHNTYHANVYTEERRRKVSEKMKDYWRKKKAKLI